MSSGYITYPTPNEVISGTTIIQGVVPKTMNTLSSGTMTSKSLLNYTLTFWDIYQPNLVTSITPVNSGPFDTPGTLVDCWDLHSLAPGTYVIQLTINYTGNLTVTSQTSNGYLFIGPNATNDPTSSTLNFPRGDDRANGVTVALGAGGTLGVTFVAPAAGPTTQVVFDVTGYFQS